VDVLREALSSSVASSCGRVCALWVRARGSQVEGGESKRASALCERGGMGGLRPFRPLGLVGGRQACPIGLADLRRLACPSSQSLLPSEPSPLTLECIRL